ncbi:hypothetical protein M8C21_029012 [Ambrosia artemisiifolia]|uniref:Trehalose-phosphatase n=1 Tax=Ambrosia artemisiifolia TaxID=4212 RepID=A0AAD5CN05_AMBAR|nr:hypothetical protein M8C21_029012 [Ambrosia artemisiifolia]
MLVGSVDWTGPVIHKLMRATVRKLAACFPTAIVSGRCRDKVYNFVKLAELYYVGSHGMDIRGPSKGSKYKNASGTKGGEQFTDAGFYDDFNMDEIDSSIEKYEVLFGVGKNDPENLFVQDRIDGLFGPKDTSVAKESSTWHGNGVQPAYSNAALVGAYGRWGNRSSGWSDKDSDSQSDVHSAMLVIIKTVELRIYFPWASHPGAPRLMIAPHLLESGTMLTSEWL